VKIRDWLARHRRSPESQSPGTRGPLFESLEPRLLLSTFFVEADADAFISAAHPLTNYGTRQDLLVGFDNADLTGGGDGQTVRSLIYFDLMGDFPPDFDPYSIADAYIMLAVTGSNNIPPATVTVNAHEAVAGWTETAVNWDNAPLYGSVIGYSDWVGQEFIDIPIDPIVVEGWYYSPELNFGLVIEAPWAEVNGRYIEMASREFTAVGPPTLHVTYGVWDEYFDVFDATIDLDPEMSEGDVAPGGVVTGTGTIYGTGYGVVDYQWNWIFPDETTGSSGPMTADMVAGVAEIPSYTAFPTDDLGQYEVLVGVDYPFAVDSNTEYYTVAQIVTQAETDLEAADLFPNSFSVEVGGTLGVQSSVVNNGPDDQTDDWTLVYYFSEDSVITSPYYPLGAFVVGDDIAYGDTFWDPGDESYRDLVVPSVPTDAYYYLGVIVTSPDDPYGGNNLLYYPSPIYVASESQPLPEIDVELGSLDNLHTYAFGGTRVGQSKSMTFTVRNEGQADLHVTQASGLDLPFAVNPVNSSAQGDDWNIAPGDTQTFAVTFGPAEEGDFNGVLTLYNDDPDESTYQMSFSGTTSMAAYEVWAGNTDYTYQPEHWRYYNNIDQQDYVLLGASSTPSTAQAFTGQYDYYVIATRARVQLDTVEGFDGSYAAGTAAAGNAEDPENIGGQPDGYYGLVGYQATYSDSFSGFVVVDNPDGWTGTTVHVGDISPTYRFHISQQVDYGGYNEPYGYEFWFDLENGGYGQIDSARFQSPSGLWYDMEYDYDPYWHGWEYAGDSFSSIAEMEAEFGVGNYLLELQTPEGTITTEFFYGDGDTLGPLAWPTQQPVPVFPVVGATGVSTTPTLQWEPLTDPNVNYIHVAVGDASEFDVFNQGVGLDVTSVSGFTLEAATNYEWYLAFQNGYSGRNEDGYSYHTSRETQTDVVFRTEGGGAVQPDLAIDWIYHVPGIYQATDSMDVAGQISSSGEGNAVAYDGEDPVPFYFEIRLSVDRSWGNADDVVLSRWAESPWLGLAIEGGQETFKLPAGVTPGPYYIGAMIDADNQITESNETNNILWSDAPDVLVAMPVPEGEARRFTIHLEAMPIYPVVVHITKQPDGDPDLTTDVDTLVFTRSNWNQPQTVFILAAEDEDTQDGSAVWTVWASEMPALTVPVAEQDNDYYYAIGGGADADGDGSGGATGVIVPGGLPAGDAPDFHQYNDPYPPSWYPGLMYCVPAASADAVVWLQEHGFDSLPGREQEVSIVTDLADDMASGDRTGTAWENVMPGLMQYLGGYYGPSEIEVTGLGVFGDGLLPDEADLDAVARWLDRPHTAVILVGSAYRGQTNLGGHAMFLAGLEPSDATRLYVHDPASGPEQATEVMDLVWSGDGYYVIHESGRPYDVPNLAEDTVRWSGAVAIRLNTAPLLDIADQQMPHSQDTLVMALPATDADGDAITYAASVKIAGAVAGKLQQRLGLTTYWGAYDNYRGWDEKYLTDQVGGWHYLLPTGELYSWGVAEPRGQLIKWYYEDPQRLLDPEPSEENPPPGMVTVDGSRLTIDPADGFVGRFVVEISANDGLVTVTDTFRVDVTNSPAVLDVPDQEMSHSQDQLVLDLPVTDADGDAITYAASVKITGAVAGKLQERLGLTTYWGAYDNYRGWDEKYLTDQVGGWHYLLPTGELYSWGVAEPQAQLIEWYYEDPQRLLDAEPGEEDSPPATVTVDGSRLTIDPADGFVGLFQVEITAADDLTMVLDSFTIMVI